MPVHMQSSYNCLTEANSSAFILSRFWCDSDCDIGSLAFVPGGGLRACPTSFIMPSPIYQCKLYCSGVIPRGLSSLACHLAANCWSKRDKSGSPPLHALIALREREREREREWAGMGASFLAWGNVDSSSRVVVQLVLAQDVQDRGKWGLYQLSEFSVDLNRCSLKDFPHAWFNLCRVIFNIQAKRRSL